MPFLPAIFYFLKPLFHSWDMSCSERYAIGEFVGLGNNIDCLNNCGTSRNFFSHKFNGNGMRCESQIHLQ